MRRAAFASRPSSSVSALFARDQIQPAIDRILKLTCSVPTKLWPNRLASSCASMTTLMAFSVKRCVRDKTTAPLSRQSTSSDIVVRVSRLRVARGERNARHAQRNLLSPIRFSSRRQTHLKHRLDNQTRPASSA
jgi:hypothetical protein